MAKKAVKTDALGQALAPENFTGNRRDRSAVEQQQTQTVEKVAEAPVVKEVIEAPVAPVKGTVAESSAPVEQNPPVVEEPKKEPVAAPAPEKGNLAAVYAEKTVIPKELRTRRIQVVVTPSIEEKLNELVAERKIRSKNDLINFLLESYFAMLEEK